jgi:predicted dehydrogenase
MSAQPELHDAGRSRPVRLGFIGLGWIGRKRLDGVTHVPGIEVAALADSVTDRARAAADCFPDAVTASDIQELLACDLDGVVIATPNSSHAEQALACLDNGVAVFCQKPLAIDSEQTTRVIEAAQAANRLLGIDYCYRHVAGMHELRARLAAGELGEVLAVDLTFHNAYGPDKPWCHDRRLAGGGCLLDLGVHLLDLALWLQDAPEMSLVSSRLFARGAAVRGCDGVIEDLAFAELGQDNGAVVRLACSWNAHVGRGAEIGLQILGTQGGAHWRNVNGSFYDFRLSMARGATTEEIGFAPDDWGARALLSWAQRLQHDRSFDSDALLIARGASLIDRIYSA